MLKASSNFWGLSLRMCIPDTLDDSSGNPHLYEMAIECLGRTVTQEDFAEISEEVRAQILEELGPRADQRE